MKDPRHCHSQHHTTSNLEGNAMLDMHPNQEQCHWWIRSRSNLERRQFPDTGSRQPCRSQPRSRTGRVDMFRKYLGIARRLRSHRLCHSRTVQRRIPTLHTESLQLSRVSGHSKTGPVDTGLLSARTSDADDIGLLECVASHHGGGHLACEDDEVHTVEGIRQLVSMQAIMSPHGVDAGNHEHRASSWIVIFQV